MKNTRETLITFLLAAFISQTAYAVPPGPMTGVGDLSSGSAFYLSSWLNRDENSPPLPIDPYAGNLPVFEIASDIFLIEDSGEDSGEDSVRNVSEESYQAEGGGDAANLTFSLS